MINSNYYVLDSQKVQLTRVQTARAAMLLSELLKYQAVLEHETIEPTRVQDMVPLCMWQFERIFSTTRIPGRDIDEIKHWQPADSRHAAVYCRGSHYRLELFSRVRRRRRRCAHVYVCVCLCVCVCVRACVYAC